MGLGIRIYSNKLSHLLNEKNCISPPSYFRWAYSINTAKDEMDWNAFSLPIANSIRKLQSLSFISEGRNVILIVGNPGVGKTHTVIALGLLACQKNMDVLYITIPNLILELKEAYKERM